MHAVCDVAPSEILPPYFKEASIYRLIPRLQLFENILRYEVQARGVCVVFAVRPGIG